MAYNDSIKNVRLSDEHITFSVHGHYRFGENANSPGVPQGGRSIVYRMYKYYANTNFGYREGFAVVPCSCQKLCQEKGIPFDREHPLEDRAEIDYRFYQPIADARNMAILDNKNAYTTLDIQCAVRQIEASQKEFTDNYSVQYERGVGAPNGGYFDSVKEIAVQSYGDRLESYINDQALNIVSGEEIENLSLNEPQLMLADEQLDPALFDIKLTDQLTDVVPTEE